MTQLGALCGAYLLTAGKQRVAKLPTMIPANATVLFDVKMSIIMWVVDASRPITSTTVSATRPQQRPTCVSVKEGNAFWAFMSSLDGHQTSDKRTAAISRHYQANAAFVRTHLTPPQVGTAGG